MDISKKDWKLFRERLSGWQENYMEGLVKEYVNFLNDDKKPASEKFWELEKRIKEDKRHLGVIMEMSKSEVIWDIVRLIRLKVIAYGDLSDLDEQSDTDMIFAKMPTEKEISTNETLNTSLSPVRIFITNSIRIEVMPECPSELFRVLIQGLKDHA